MEINNIGSTSAGEIKREEKSHVPRRIHIQVRNAKRNKKYNTIISNINPHYNFNKILAAMKKDMCCTGAVKEDDKGQKIIELRGDQHIAVAQWLLSCGMVKSVEQLELHGAK